MNNLFTGIEITFVSQMFDNSAYNATFDREGFRQHMLPAQESSVARVEREITSWLTFYDMKWEREFTTHGEVVTMYINAPKVPAILKDKLSNLKTNLLMSVAYGRMKADATFKRREVK